MKFNLYTREDSLSKNKYGITEVNNEEYLEPHLFDGITTLRTRLEKQIARRSGQVIAAPLDTELRWYLGPRSK